MSMAGTFGNDIVAAMGDIDRLVVKILICLSLVFVNNLAPFIGQFINTETH